MININERSSCIVSNCRTHETVIGLPQFLKDKYKHYNCTIEHPCLECVKCPDCKSGKAYHSSIHGEWKPKERKKRVVLTKIQKQEILNLSDSGATPQDLANQFNVTRQYIYKVLATFQQIQIDAFKVI